MSGGRKRGLDTFVEEWKEGGGKEDISKEVLEALSPHSGSHNGRS